MKLRIHHTTDYRYLAPISRSSNDVRLTPMRRTTQNTAFFLLRVLPPSRLKHFRDFYGNLVTHFEVEEPHQNLLIESQCTITTEDPYARGTPLGAPLSLLGECDLLEELQPFLNPSSLVQITPELWRSAINVFSEQQDCFELATGLMAHVYSSCQYAPGITKVSTTSADFFTTRKGVCQDFAHLMIAMCRAVHLPARYVSGYLYDARRTDIRGAHASHAWVEVWIPNAGWFAMDPTNNSLTRETYVTVAIGRDYHDAAPVTGSYWGNSGCMMKVSVHLEEA